MSNSVDVGEDPTPEALEQSPPSGGMSFRGGYGDVAASVYREGVTFVVPGVLLTSREPRVATADFADGDVMAVFGAAGRDVSPYSPHPQEQETAFAPGSSFTVMRQGMVAGLRVTIVVVRRELRGVDADVDAMARRVGATLVLARSAPEVNPPRPYRYRGPVGIAADDAHN